MTNYQDDLEPGPSSPKVFETKRWLAQFEPLGVKPLPIKPGTKHVLARGYTKPEYQVNDRYFDAKNIGIGCITTATFIDIDCDSPTTIHFAKRLLPPTITYGRTGKPESHYLYTVTGDPIKKKAFTNVIPLGLSKADTAKFIKKNTIVEYRSAKHMTVLPGSVHESGEVIEWTDRDALQKCPTEIDNKALYTKVQLIALAQIIVEKFWADGQRQTAALYLAGALYHAKVSEEDAETLFEAICEYTEDDELVDRLKVLKSTYKKGKDGEEVGGFGALKNELDIEDNVIAHCRRLLIGRGYFSNSFAALNLKTNRVGEVISSSLSITTILTHDDTYKGNIRFNELTASIETRALPRPKVFGGDDEDSQDDWKALVDADLVRLSLLFQEGGLTPKNDHLLQAVQAVAYENRYDPIALYLDGLDWDGKSRLKTWLRDYLNVVGDEGYIEAVGIRVLIGAVARAREPGCKVDNMMVLEGMQGIGKSNGIMQLVPDKSWFSEGRTSRLDDKDTMQDLRGKWIIEQAEMTIKSNNLESTKSFISRTSDYYRNSYGRSSEDHPRRSIFIGTTNRDDYLRDDTGNRRYWPVETDKLKEIDFEKIAAVRDQLWAEADALYKKGQKWWMDTPKLRELVKAEQGKRMWRSYLEQDISAEADKLHKKYLDEGYYTADNHVSVRNVLKALNIEPRHSNEKTQNGISAALKNLGWKKSSEEGTHTSLKEGKRIRIRPWIPIDEKKWREQTGYKEQKEEPSSVIIVDAKGLAEVRRARAEGEPEF